MTKYPIVLIVSEGQTTPSEIISNIRKLPSEEDVESLGFFPTISDSINGHIFHLKTKYYTTDLYLVPFQEDISRFPLELQEDIEGVLIYFDSGVRSFSKRIPIYANYLKSHDIEMGILLCDNLYEDSNEGITYKEAKQESRFLDVIELGRKSDEDEDEDPHDPKGYDELHQALRSFIWSNINVQDVKPFNFPKLAQSPTDDKEPDLKEDEEVPAPEDDKSVEAELDMFEKLLSDMMTFKDQTANMSRNERLAMAEKFAQKFDKLLDFNDSSDDEANN